MTKPRKRRRKLWIGLVATALAAVLAVTAHVGDCIGWHTTADSAGLACDDTARFAWCRWSSASLK